MSKIFAISSTGKSEKSFLDLRFGKCENVVIYNAETGNSTFWKILTKIRITAAFNL
jgi:predicted Fe-Mo cluster-binding NifX family protein